MSTSSHSSPETALTRHPTVILPDVGYRRKVANTLLKINGYLETAVPDRSISGFKKGKAFGYPEVPGEDYRNPVLRRTREQYDHNREMEISLRNLSRQNSQAGSFSGSVASGFGGEGSSDVRTGSSRKARSHRSTSPFPDRDINSSEPTNDPSISDASGVPQRVRRDTLEVPKPTIASHHNHTWNSQSASSAAPIGNLPEVHSAPSIIVSPNTDSASTSNRPVSNNPPTPSSSELPG